MSAAVRPAAVASLDARAQEILSRLVTVTQRGSDSLEVHTLNDVLDARDEMIAALEGVTEAMWRSRAGAGVRAAVPASAVRDELVEVVSALQRANVVLLERVQAECDRLRDAVIASDRPDDVAGAYGPASAAAARLDLVR